MNFTQIPTTAFENIQLNAGILLDGFTPSTGVIGNILGATTGGVKFTDTVEYTDFGEDIDNCPKNMKELKKINSREVKMGGTFVTLSVSTAKLLVGAGDIDVSDATHIIPRDELADTDFDDIWWVGDYSDKNTGSNAGFVAIHLLNALNTAGFQIQSGDKAKGQFAFEFTGHYSIDAQDTVPYEVYVKEGGDPTPSIVLDRHVASIENGGNVTLVATTIPNSAIVSWTSNDTNVASVVGGLVSAEGTGNAIITASITVDGVTYSDTCTVIVNANE